MTLFSLSTPSTVSTQFFYRNCLPTARVVNHVNIKLFEKKMISSGTLDVQVVFLNFLLIGPGYTKLFPTVKEKKKKLTKGKFPTVRRRVTQKFSDGYPTVSFFFFKNFCFFFFGGAADSFFSRCKINKKKLKFEINTVR